MKTLLLLRHTKSGWEPEGVPDHDRSLKKSGKRDARRIGWLLLEQDLVPQLVISSTAKRARSTAKRVVSACGYTGEVVLDRTLYDAGPMGYIRVLKDVEESYQRVMVVGHNPGLEVLLEVLTGASAWLPAGALARLDLPIRYWTDLQEYIGGEVVGLWVPKQLKHLSDPARTEEALTEPDPSGTDEVLTEPAPAIRADLPVCDTGL